MSKSVRALSKYEILCQDGKVGFKLNAPEGIFSDFAETRLAEIKDNYLKLESYNDFFEYIIQLGKDGLIDYVDLYIYKTMPFSTLITLDIFGIGKSQYNSIAYFSEPVAFDKLDNTFNSAFDDYIRGSYLFAAPITEIYKATGLITKLNVAGFNLDVKNIKYKDITNLYKSKPHGESLLTIPDDMYKKLTKANLLGKKAIVTGLDGDVPIIRYE